MMCRWIFLLGLLGMGEVVAEPLKVMTYNLRYITREDRGEKAWTARRDQAAELIGRYDADLVGIQEGLGPMMDDLAERVKGYAVIGVGREDGLNRGEEAALLVKADRFRVQKTGTFWLSDKPEEPGSATWGNTVTRVCTWAKLWDRKLGKPVWFYNTHLDHASEEARQRGVRLILERMGEEVPEGGAVVLTGDFNATEANPLHGLLREKGLQDVWMAEGAEGREAEGGTFHHFRGVRDGGRIDYIYAGKKWVVKQVKVLRDHREGGNYPSDHFPVMATLEESK